jgi:hypothetical protein
MDFKSIMYDLIVEEVKNKKLLNALHKKWNSQDNSVTPEVTEFIFTRFMGGTNNEGLRVKPLKDELTSLKKPEIVSFLQKYNGENGRDKFIPSKLKDVRSYTFPQIKNLFAQFGISVGIKKDVRFFEDPSVIKNDRAGISEKLWNGDKFKIYDDGNGFRVYQPKTQRDAISFGFYQKEVAQENFTSSNKWCVTNYKDDTMSNLWQSYRDRNPSSRTFYFVIDETKPKDNQFHISALQVLSQPENGFPYRITNASNTNYDMLVSLNDPQNQDKSLQHIYTQTLSQELLEKLESVPFDEEKEMDLKVSNLETLLRRIKEDASSPYDFVIQDPEVKRAYMQRPGNFLETIRSFNSLTDSDLRLYFEIQLDARNPSEVFKDYETFVYLLKKRGKSVGDYIVSKLKDAGSSVGEIVTGLMLSTFNTDFVSKQDEDIKVVKDNNSTKVGIFDAKKGGWLKFNNITYTPDYYEVTSEQGYGVFDFNKDKDGEDNSPETNSDDLPPQYLLGVYSISKSMDDNTNFYVLDPQDGDGKVLIFSHNTWKTQAEPYWLDFDETDVDYDKEYDNIMDKSTGGIS